MKLRKVTKTQAELLDVIKLTNFLPFEYDIMKEVANMRSFDLTFNALLHKGFLEHVHSDDFSNQFKMISGIAWRVK